jgi:PPK2 family polyphosphate:nucleotide phosphotransferase
LAWERFKVRGGKKLRLKDHDPASVGDYHSKDAAQKRLRDGLSELQELQNRLYAQDRWSLLLIFQAMDAAGKDSTIKHVMSGVDPHGCQVFSFKAPSPEELDHDFMWRTTRCLPERGRIGVFNRSYYEEVLIVRVHPEILLRQKLERRLITRDIWKERFEDIRAFERYLTRNGTVVRKFFLTVSQEEQRRRFLERLDEPEKHWKFALRDVYEREHWEKYQNAYEDMIRQTSTSAAPWYVVPADHKWFTRMVVADVIIDTLRDMNLQYPRITGEKKKEIEEAKRLLRA